MAVVPECRLDMRSWITSPCVHGREFALRQAQCVVEEQNEGTGLRRPGPGHCRIGKASSQQAPKVVSSSPSSRPPPPSLAMDVSGNIAQEIPKYADIIGNVRTKAAIPVLLHHWKPAVYPEPDTAAKVALILPGPGKRIKPLGRP